MVPRREKLVFNSGGPILILAFIVVRQDQNVNCACSNASDPPRTSFTTLSIKNNNNDYNTWHLTCDRWLVKCETWHATCDTWNVTSGGRWTFSQNFSSLAHTVWKSRFDDNIFTNLSNWITTSLVQKDICSKFKVIFPNAVEFNSWWRRNVLN